MKAALALLFVSSMIAGSVQGAPASPLDRGGWDGNDARVSSSQSKLLVNRFPGGGWDANDARVTVTKSKLLTESHPGGGWDLNDAGVVKSGSKLLTH